MFFDIPLFSAFFSSLFLMNPPGFLIDLHRMSDLEVKQSTLGRQGQVAQVTVWGPCWGQGFSLMHGSALSQLIDSGSPTANLRARAPERLPRLRDGVPTPCQWHGGAGMAVGGRRGHL